jgi:anti-anti-sigma regulatory factor
MLNITVELEQGAQPVTVMRLEGELDQSNYLDVVNRARELAAAGTRNVLLDLAALSYMGSSGIFALRSIAIVLSGEEPPDPEAGWGAVHELEGRSADTSRVKILNPQPSVDRVLERTGMKRYFEMFTDRAAAVAAF